MTARHSPRRSEIPANLLNGLRSNFRTFSECALIDHANYPQREAYEGLPGQLTSASMLLAPAMERGRFGCRGLGRRRR